MQNEEDEVIQRRGTGWFSLILVVAALALGGAPLAGQSSFSGGMGVNFFRYDTAYLTALSATYLHDLGEGLELNLGAEFGINTDENDKGDTVPSFLIPLNLGLNFTFPRDAVTFVFGTGISPVFNFNPDTDDEFLFYMGPYAKGAVRVRVHPIMSLYTEVQQDLLIGGTDWINTGTRFSLGINFALDPLTP
ncbi:hypothetical protein AU468_06360 [Alkalispirochaeta sphaeroplastigenens]|uniref:Outer membrane protein beta-barrel domain-containing protein n=1 Tax=Alkalispirochaeta sphaeroplastigenens TaxID=1187066 RepID=A0A2S4JRV8_9SPIO|nr:hypothetical protein AU468_06360 [Alkalispirochaeta sphaeroplastigenens]